MGKLYGKKIDTKLLLKHTQKYSLEYANMPK